MSFKTKLKCFFGKHQWATAPGNAERICMKCAWVEIHVIIDMDLSSKWIKSSRDELDRRTAEEMEQKS